MQLEISLFKFDYKSDYLPYYKKYFLPIKEEKTLLDILNTIDKEASFGYEKSLDFGVVLNGLYTDLSISIKEIVDDFGTEVIIEPLSIKRASKDLLIDTKDFEEKLRLLDFIIDEEDKKEYLSYKNLYYASNTLNFEDNYFGDALFLLASNLIIKHKEYKEKILEAITCTNNGVILHTNLSNRIYNYDVSKESTINNLKKELKIYQTIEKQNFIKKKSKTIDFGTFNNHTTLKHRFKNFNIAYYCGNTTCKKTDALLHQLDASIIQLPSMKNDLAMHSFHINPELTYKLASHMLLDAYDNNADFVVVNNESTFYLLDNHRSALEKSAQREIPIPIIHINELQQLATGFHDEVRPLLKHHHVAPQII